MSKADPLMAAIGDVDEANSAIGIAVGAVPEDVAAALSRIQNDLFDLGADIATRYEIAGALRITAGQIARLEREIDAMNAALDPLTSFILPGGTPGAAHLHLARAITRRAERSAVTANHAVLLSPEAVRYLNRLSDWLFVAARHVNQSAGGDVLWVPGASRWYLPGA